MRVNWESFKAFVEPRFLSIQEVKERGKYLLEAHDGNVKLECVIPADEEAVQGSEQEDYEQNYQVNANKSFSDIDGTPFQRYKASKKGWTYLAVPFEFQTSRLSDLTFQQDHTGNNRTWFTCKIYNDSDVEITTAGILNANLNTAVKTVIDFEPPFDYEIIGGNLRTVNSITADVRLWIVGAPDIPAQYGGSKEMAGGINLKYLSPGQIYSVDGRVTKMLPYSATTHSNKLRLIFKYAAGTNEQMAVNFEIYRA